MDIQNKLPLVSSALGNLIFQLFVMYRTTELTLDNAWLKTMVDTNNVTLVISNFALFFTLIFTRFSIPLKLLIFTSMSIITGMLIHKIADMKEALLEAVGIFICMLFAGVITVKLGYNLKTLGMVLVFTLLTLIFLRIVSPNKKEYTKIGMSIFALFVVYDTNQILQRNYSGDFVNATLDYFTDIVNLLTFAAED